MGTSFPLAFGWPCTTIANMAEDRRYKRNHSAGSERHDQASDIADRAAMDAFKRSFESYLTRNPRSDVGFPTRPEKKVGAD